MVSGLRDWGLVCLSTWILDALSFWDIIRQKHVGQIPQKEVLQALGGFLLSL